MPSDLTSIAHGCYVDHGLPVGDALRQRWDGRGGAVRLCSDLYKAAHRQYGEFLAGDVRIAGVKVRPDTHRWGGAAVEDHVRE
ncbi:zeta toxin family protein [Streptomyces sp. bgisy100]|uniref:zeta toxin family protein n=1 Tax=Streptomyces sp. bgisy100 TaxID=3413783 RepID=UPI003D7196C8